MNKSNFTLVYLFIIAFISTQAQTNPRLHQILNTPIACIEPNEKSLIAVSWFKNEAKIIKYDLSSGKVIKTYKSKLPNNPITLVQAVPNSPIIYLISSRKTDDTPNRYFDAIYQFNSKTDKLKLLYTENMNYKAPYRVGKVGNNLVFTTQKEPTRIYDIRRNHTELLNANIDYQLLSIAPEKNGYLMINVKKIYKNQVPVFFMDTEKNILDSIGAINPDLVIQTKKGAFQLPNLSLADSNNFWAIDAIRYNCFPLYSIKIGIHPFWLKQVYDLEQANEISAIIDASKNYIVLANTQNLDVYKINYKEGALNSDDIAQIEELIGKRAATNRLALNSDITNEVFNAVFYHVVSSGKDLDKINKKLVAQQYGSYNEVVAYDSLIAYFNTGFSLNSPKEALLVQDALEVLYPIDEFNKQFIKNYSEPSRWVFIRGKAFDKFYGIVVNVNDSGEPMSVNYINDL